MSDTVRMSIRRGDKLKLRWIMADGATFAEATHALVEHKRLCPALNHKLAHPDGEQLDPASETSADERSALGALTDRLRTTRIRVEQEDKRLMRRYTHGNAAISDGFVELLAHYRACPDAPEHAPRGKNDPIRIPGSSLDTGDLQMPGVR